VIAVDAADLCQALLAINSDARDLCEGLHEEQLAWRPGSGKWSIAENLIQTRSGFHALQHS
jgi:hypothetical protein